jgi:transglutaminase-like putative cysteine protease
MAIVSSFFQKIGERNSLIFILLIAAVSSAAYGLADSIRGLDPVMLLLLGSLALLLGWYLGRENLGPAWGWGLLLLLGVEVIVIVVAQLGSPLWAFLRALDRFVYEWLQRPVGSGADWSALMLSSLEINAALRDLFADVAIWARALFSAGGYFSARAITLLWNLVIWITAGWMGWSLRRWSRPLVSALPLGVTLGAVLSYTWTSPTTLTLFLAAVLLLIGLITNWERQTSWERDDVDYPHSAYSETAFISVGISVLLAILMLVIPAISLRSIVRFVDSLFNPVEQDGEDFADSLGLERRSASGEYPWLQGVTAENLPRDHLLGSGPELSKQLVMTVEITAGLPQTSSQAEVPLYWRSITYDIYTGRGWRSGETEMQSYQAGDQVVIADFAFRRAIQQRVRFPERREDFLYAAGDFVAVDRDYQVAWREKPDQQNPGGDFLGAVVDARSYEAQSLIALLDERALRRAVGPYPAWVRERYLDLPDSLPRRVIDLAETWTAEADTAYDKAVALERNLRSYSYTLDVPAPPDDQDVVAYFLFDLGEGYCDYYATSMAVMARAVGLPARMAIGYARGSYDAANQRYIVTEANAHSWVEIYFPEIGWVPFEPTAGLPAITRPEELAEGEEQFTDSIEPLHVSLWERIGGWLKALLWAVAGMLIAFVLWLSVDAFRLRRASPEESLHRIYRRLYHFGRRLDVPTRQDITPREFSHALVARIGDLSDETALAQASTQVHRLTDVYTQMAYSPRSLHQIDQRQAVETWLPLRRKLVIVWLRQRIGKISYNS